MRQEAKVQVYQELYSSMKDEPGVEGLGYPKEKKNFDFFFDFEGMHVDFSLMDGADLFRMETSRIYPGCDDRQLGEISKELETGRFIRCSYYNEKITLKHTHPLAGKPDEVAAREVKQSVRQFLAFLKDNKVALGKHGYVPVKKEHPEILPDEPPKIPTEPESAVITEPLGNLGQEPAGTLPVTETECPPEPEQSPECQAESISLPESQMPEYAAEGARQDPGLETGMPGGQKTPAMEMQMPESQTYSAEVVKQMRSMYADMDKVFRARKEQMDYREETLDKRESVLDSREAGIDIKAEELQRKAEQWDIREAEYQAREMQLSVREETAEAAERSLEDRKRYIDSLESEKNRDDAGALRKQIAELRSERDAQEHVITELRETMRKESARLQLEAHSADKRWQTLCSQKDAEYARVCAEANALKTELEGKRPADVMEVLSALDMAGTEENGSIHVQAGAISIRIRPDRNMLRAERPVKRGGRYRGSAIQWNEKDETMAFLVYDKKIECLLCYHDLKLALETVMEKFSDLK